MNSAVHSALRRPDFSFPPHLARQSEIHEARLWSPELASTCALPGNARRCLPARANELNEYAIFTKQPS